MRRIRNYIRLKEVLTFPQAKKIINKYDPSFSDWENKDSLTKLRRKLAIKYHPDKKNSDPSIMKDINEALDTLINDSNSSYDNSYYEPKKQKSNYTDEYLIKGIPVWAWAGWSGGIYPHWDETSQYSLIKKKAWEILGSPKVSEVNSNNQVNFEIFSGILSRDMITVLSDINNYDVLKKVCPLIINWSHTKSKNIDAVIISNQESKDNDNYVVAPVIDGKVDDTNNWFTLGSDSFNLNPFNDKNFVLNLRKQLDLLKNK